ncbi:uncharacterized protein LOC121859391 [Homarus americanus]|uniref:uncharacterized protein LOC121859391 n=1 Tax=Homarus americanus TaxID=6706 RepID=UPI001C4734E4|nr:uncharacterized protein LOC121859391 [Homarus americanus]
MRRPPPWHWEILLNQHRQENPRRNRNKWEKREERQEWDRACHWQQRKRFLFTHSVFQSLGWGSAVVLTWSIYNDWGNHPYSYHWNTRRQCKEIFLSQSEEEINSKPKTNDSEQHQHNKEGEDQYCYSVSQSGCLGDHNCQCPQHTLYKENFCSQQSQNFFCPETNRSLFSFLWSSSEHKFLIEQPTDTLSDVLDIPEIQEFQDKDRIELPVVQSKFSVEVQPKDSLSDVLDTRDIHSNIQEFQGHKRLELQQDYENETELSIEGEAQVCEQDEDSGRPVKGDLKCSLNSELCNSLPASGLEQDAINTSDGLGLLQGETLFEENGIVECMKVSREIKGSEECVPCGSGILTKPQAVRSEEVKIKDCTSDDSGQSTSTSSNSSSHQLDKMTIEEFSDSLTKILMAGSQDIKKFQDQLMGVLKDDVNLSLVDTDPDSAVLYFQAGALLGDPSSAFNLALCYHLGRGVTQDFKMARELYESASLAGHGWATYNLAVLMNQGQGGARDSDRTYNLLLQAGKRGVSEAQEVLKQLEEQEENELLEESSLKSSQSEPSLTSVSSRKWSSSYSTSDLEFMDETDLWDSTDFSTDKDYSESTKSVFYLG